MSFGPSALLSADISRPRSGAIHGTVADAATKRLAEGLYGSTIRAAAPSVLLALAAASPSPSPASSPRIRRTPSASRPPAAVPSRRAVAQPPDGAGVQLRDPRFVHADFRADFLHRHFAIVIEADRLPLAHRQRRNRGVHPVACFRFLMPVVGSIGFGRHEGSAGSFRRSVRRSPRQRRRGFDGCWCVGWRRLKRFSSDSVRGRPGSAIEGSCPEFAAQRFAGGIELAAPASDAARPGGG